MHLTHRLIYGKYSKKGFCIDKLMDCNFGFMHFYTAKIWSIIDRLARNFDASLAKHYFHLCYEVSFSIVFLFYYHYTYYWPNGTFIFFVIISVPCYSFLCQYISSSINGRQHNYRIWDECNCTFSLNTKKDLLVEERAMHTIVALKMYLQKIAFSEE